MIFTTICVFGFLFVVVSLPFALRYETRRRKRRRRYTWKDWAWPDDPNLEQRFPHQIPGPLAPRPPRDERW